MAASPAQDKYGLLPQPKRPHAILFLVPDTEGLWHIHIRYCLEKYITPVDLTMQGPRLVFDKN